MSIEQILSSYKNKLDQLRYIIVISTLTQILSGSWFLFLPSFSSEIINPILGLFVALLLILLGFLTGMSSIERSSSKLIKLLRVLAIGGIAVQISLDIETVFPITIFIISVIVQTLVSPYLEVIQRTQNYSSHTKLTDEVLNSIKHTDRYLEEQITWIFNSILLLVILSILTLFALEINQLLPVLLPNVEIAQYIALGALSASFILFVYYGFPDLEDKSIEESYGGR